MPLSRPICLSTAVDATSNGRKVAVVTLAASLLIQLNRWFPSIRAIRAHPHLFPKATRKRKKIKRWKPTGNGTTETSLWMHECINLSIMIVIVIIIVCYRCWWSENQSFPLRFNIDFQLSLHIIFFFYCFMI